MPRINFNTDYEFKNKTIEFLEHMMNYVDYHHTLNLDYDNFSGNVGNIDLATNNITFYLKNLKDQTSNYNIDGLDDALPIALAHELGHFLDNTDALNREKEISLVEELYKDKPNKKIINKLKEEIYELNLERELNAYLNGRNLLTKLNADENLIKNYSKREGASFETYRKLGTHMVERIENDTLKFKDEGVSLENNKIYINFKNSQINYEENVKNRENYCHIYIDGNNETMQTFNSSFEEDSVIVSSSYDLLSHDERKVRRDLAKKEGLRVLIPEEFNQSLFDSLGEKNEEERKRTIIFVDDIKKISNESITKIKELGVKITDKFEEVKEWIANFSEKIQNKKLDNAILNKNITKIKNLLQIGTKPNKEQKVMMVSDREIKNEVLGELKKQTSKTLDKSRKMKNTYDFER